MSDGSAIIVERLTKRYGVHAAVDDVSFEVKRGEVVGFLGPNGAGKSTTLRILVGFLGATSGRAYVDGHDVTDEPDQARRALGYMPEAVPLYPEMRVREYLRFRADLKRVGRGERKAAVDRAMELARVTDVADTLIDHLSKGYRQRVGLADALVAKPRVLVLDEPTAGMDPNQIRDVRAMIRSLGGEQTVLLSTHILSEVEASCSRVVVIDRGKLVAEGTPGELSDKAMRAARLLVVARGDEAKVRAAIASVEGLRLVSLRSEDDVHHVELESSLEDARGKAAAMTEALVEALVAGGVRVRSIGAGKASLEDVFTALTTDPVREETPTDEEPPSADRENEREEDE